MKDIKVKLEDKPELWGAIEAEVATNTEYIDTATVQARNIKAVDRDENIDDSEECLHIVGTLKLKVWGSDMRGKKEMNFSLFAPMPEYINSIGDIEVETPRDWRQSEEDYHNEVMNTIEKTIEENEKEV